MIHLQELIFKLSREVSLNFIFVIASLFITLMANKSSKMSYNEKMADRVREIIMLSTKNIEEKKMFGGLCFMVNDKMCVGVESERLMLRLDPAKYDEVMEKNGCKPMDFTGKVMKGYVFVDLNVLNTKTKLAYWISLAMEYNKIAKLSKKKKGK